MSIVFTTDPQIKRGQAVVLLKDDKGMFPPYNSTFLVKYATAPEGRGRTCRRRSTSVNKNLTAEVMQELNARVDLDKQTPAAAAAAYLKQFELVS